MIGIGIDTGGTCTDVVAYDRTTGNVLQAVKTPTTHEDLKIGILRGLDQLDPVYLKRAERLALSTTLATNACLEDKGGRAKELLIGVERESVQNLEEIYRSYGFRGSEELYFLPGKPENLFQDPEEPDWEMLRKNAVTWFGDAEAIGVTQIYPQANGGRFERIAKEILESTLHVPVTTAYDMFEDTDIWRRAAGTFLNARLIPLVTAFLDAVRQALEERKLDLPVFVVTSDGSLMPEKYAREAPVTTLLSGPAASAVGGSTLYEAEKKSERKPERQKQHAAVIADMGGTTTDLVLLENGRPVTSPKGIRIGSWQTTVKGLDVHTTLLGGDSAVRFRDGQLVLDGDRVIPISQLSMRYPEVCAKLQRLAEAERKHTRMLHEFYVLVRDPGEQTDLFTEEEKMIIRALRKGPLMTEELAEAAGKSIYKLGTDRLEREGILIKSGLTPTDMMVLRGDLDLFDGTAAQAACRFVANNLLTADGSPFLPEMLPAAVYQIVEKKMYISIAEILLQHACPEKIRRISQESLEEMVSWAYADAEQKLIQAEEPEQVQVREQAGLQGVKQEQKWVLAEERPRMQEQNAWPGELVHFIIETPAPIIGVGAPTHVFLPRVAELLGTTAILDAHAGVANAIGAIAGDATTEVIVHVKAEYDGAVPDGFSVMDGEEKRRFETYEEAETFGEQLAKKQVVRKAVQRGILSNTYPDNKDPDHLSETEYSDKISLQKKEIRSGTVPDVFFETVIRADISE